MHSLKFAWLKNAAVATEVPEEKQTDKLGAVDLSSHCSLFVPWRSRRLARLYPMAGASLHGARTAGATA